MKKRKTVKKCRPILLVICRVFLIFVLSVSATAAIGAAFIFITAAADINDSADAVLFSNIGQYQTTYIYGADGQEYSNVFLDNDMKLASSDEISDNLKHAFVAIEDKRFFSHEGVDWYRTLGAALNSVFHFNSRFGGSTITQQLVKNVLGENEISARRKAKEIIRATRLEKRYTKDEILTMYLNVIPLSSRCIGVYSASVFYFGVPPSELSAAQAASIAAIANAPSKYDPLLYPDENLRRRNIILGVMHSEGYLSDAEYDRELSTPLVTVGQHTERGQRVNDWFTETVCSQVISDLMDQKGMSKEAATLLVYSGGLKINSTVWREAQEYITEYFSDMSNFTLGSTEDIDYSFILTDPYTGELIGIAGGAGKKKANRILNRAWDVRRPPGSALKPVALYAPLLNRGDINYATVLPDVPLKLMKNGEEILYPRNSPNIYQGRITIHRALACSKNSIAVRLYNMLGADEIYAGLRKLGFESILSGSGGITDMDMAPLALGQLSVGVTLRELACSYTPLAAEGVYSSIYSYTAVYDPSGRLLLEHKNSKTPVWSRETAFIMTKMLEETVRYGTAANINLKYSADVAGKTGTTGGELDKLFVGYTPYMLGAIICSSKDGEAIAGRCRSHTAVWDDIMTELTEFCEKRYGYRGFTMPQGIVMKPFCEDSGEMPSELCELDIRGERIGIGYFVPSNCPRSICDTHVEAWLDPMSGDIYEYGTESDYELIKIAMLDCHGETVFHDVKTLDDKFYICYYKSDQDPEKENDTDTPDD